MSMTFETDDVTSSIRQVLHGQFKGEINHSTGTFFFSGHCHDNTLDILLKFH